MVALKTLPEWPPPSPVALERFNRAAFALAQVTHPNLPVLYETGTSDGYHYAALEHIQGRTMQQLLAERGKVSERRAVWVGLQAARALTALHEKGFLHRNVKPKNILVHNDGRAWLTGLGLAHHPSARFSHELEAKTIGTPHYMAPEIIRGCCIDERSDLYSLGATLYALVAGRPPFDKGHPAAVMARHLTETPRPLLEVRPDLSAEFVSLVDKLLVKCPHERLGSAREAVELLEALAAKHSAPPVRRAEPKARPEAKAGGPFVVLAGARRSEAVRRHWWKAAAILFFLVMACLGACLAWLTQPPKPPRPPPGATPATETRRDPAAETDARAQEERRLRAEAEREFQRLKQTDFSRRPLFGAKAWEAFLQTFPAAPEPLRTEAEIRIKGYREKGERREPLPPAGGELEF
jgi:serine/threonine-protein kinase